MTDFRSFKIKEIYKNFLFVGSGTGYTSGGILGDGKGIDAGVVIYNDRTEFTVPVYLLGTMQLANGNLFTASPTQTALSDTTKSAVVSNTSIKATSTGKSIEVTATQLLVNGEAFTSFEGSLNFKFSAT